MTWQGDVGAEVLELFCDAQEPVVLALRDAWCDAQVTRWGAGRARRGSVRDASWSREARAWELLALRIVRMRDAPRPIPRCPEADSHGCPECGARFASAASVVTHSWRVHGT